MHTDRIGIYRVMLDESRRIGAPINWKTDLTKHDRDAVINLKPGGHYWIVRENGTHFCHSKQAARDVVGICTTRAVFFIHGGHLGPDSWDMNEIAAGSLYS